MFQAGISMRFVGLPLGASIDQAYSYKEYSTRFLSATEILAALGSLLAFSAGLFAMCWSKEKDIASKASPGQAPRYSCKCLPWV